MKRDKNFDYIRVVAMTAIVLCHFFQVLDKFYISSWLNTGVQIFFVLSARLLCNKTFENKKEIFTFYKSRLLRIYIPVWIYLICLVPALFLVGRAPEPVAVIMYFVGLAGFSPSGVLGLGHFWYITVLLICYTIVPLLYAVAEKCSGYGKLKALVLRSLIPVVFILAFAFTPYKFYGVNIALFCAMYFYFFSTKEKEFLAKKSVKTLLIPTIFAVVIKVCLDSTEIKNDEFYDGIAVTAIKAIIGIFLFFLMYLLFSQRKKEREPKLLLFISDMSYEIYIVHQFILLFLVEVVSFFKSSTVGGAALLVCSGIIIFANAVVVFCVKKFAEKRIFKK